MNPLKKRIPWGEEKRITGLWIKNSIGKTGKVRMVLKSAKLNHEGFDNFQYFGKDTVLIVVPNFTKRKDNKSSPDYFLLACKDFSSVYY